VRYRLNQLLWTALDWDFPPNCEGCDKLGVQWCPESNQVTRKIESHIFSICGQLMAIGDLWSLFEKKVPIFTGASKV